MVRWIAISFLFSLSIFAYAVGEDDPTLTDKLKENEEYRTVAIGNVDRIQLSFEPKEIMIGKSDIVKRQEDSTGQSRVVSIVPLKKGNTTVDIFDQKGNLGKRISYTVVTDDLSKKVMAIRTLLVDIEGIRIESVDDKIVIDGELIVPRDFDRILTVQQAYPDVLNLVSLSRISRDAIARRMQKEINDDPGGVNVQVKIINDTFFLLGKVDSTIDRERAETIAQTYLPEVMSSPSLKEGTLVPGAKKYSIRNLIQVEEPPPAPAPKMVRITYHFVEIGKEFLKSSFFKWAPSLSTGAGIQIGESTTGGAAGSSNGSFTGVISSLIPKLQSGANGGFARVLFSTVQVGEDSSAQEVNRQDQVPYIAAVINGVPIPENASVGINVQTTPQILGDEKVRMQTTISFSALAGAGAGGKPRVVSTQMKNQVIVKSGDSAALGGLISSESSKDIDKDPESGGDPSQGSGNPIFTLLRSKAFRQKKTQFVVFITPKIIADAGEGTADIKAKILNNSNKKRRRVIP